MLNYNYCGEIEISKFKEASEIMNGIILESNLNLVKHQKENNLFYEANEKSSSIKAIFSLRNRFPSGLDGRLSSTIFKNEISWNDYNLKINNFYKEFANIHEKLFKYYEQIGINNLTTWSSWGKEESDLFLSKKLDFLYSGKDENIS